MRRDRLAQVDVNLLVLLAIIAEEQSVSKAARRIRWCTSTLNRALQKAREMFQDELLTRTSSGFRPTARGQKILDAMEDALPALELAIQRDRFRPKIESSHFRIAATDEICAQVLAFLCRNFVNKDHRVNLDAVPWPVRPLDALEGGKIDLLLAPDPHMLPWDAERDGLYREGWICAVWSQSEMGEHPTPKPLTLSGYAKAEHLIVSPRAHFRSALDDGLSRRNVYRRSRVRVPYFGAVLACLPGTELVLTLPASIRALVERDPKLRLVQAPPELPPLEVWMAWHPRLNDDARHVWLRERMRAAHPAKCLHRSACRTTKWRALSSLIAVKIVAHAGP